MGHYAQVSLGYQLHDWLGFGLSAGNYDQYSMYLNRVRGAAVHYRARPGKWRIQLDAGFLHRWHISDSGRAFFTRQAGFDPLLRLGLSWMPWPVVGIGLSGVYVFPFDFHAHYPSTPPYEFYGTTSFFTLHPSLIINLPGRWR